MTNKIEYDDLTKLAIKYGTDKWGSHYYTQHYHTFFHHLREQPIKFLEIGVGGYNDPEKGGESLRMWKEYFPKAQIYAIDICDKSLLEEERITIYKGSQVDKKFLKKIVNEIGEFDIIIDDGSHLNEHIIKTFQILFPTLKKNGIYAIEDLQTSYWRHFGGDSLNLNNKSTAMNYFKKMIHGLNFQEFHNPFYTPSYTDKNITGMSFFHNMLFIQKGNNSEGTNIVKDNVNITLKLRIKYIKRKVISHIHDWFR